MALPGRTSCGQELHLLEDIAMLEEGPHWVRVPCKCRHDSDEKDRLKDAEIHHRVNEPFDLSDSSCAFRGDRIHTYKLASPPPKVTKIQPWFCYSS